MKATIYKSTGSWYIAKRDDGKAFNCRLKGAIKLDGLTSTNPVAVGDLVEIEPEENSRDTAVISKIHDRENFIARSSPHAKNSHHIIAANISQALLIVTLKQPRTSFGFIDRFLVTAEAYHIPVIIAVNKIDLYRKKEIALLNRLQNIYAAIGYRVVEMSIIANQGVEEINALLANKTTLICGHSGVGKSSFINSLLDIDLKTASVSNFSGKGMHTTTFAEMYDLPDGGRIIDTPGIKEFGLFDFNKTELSHYFPEMLALLPNCQFNNCLHINEPGCAIRQAVDEGTITEERFFSYYNILESLNDKNYK